MTIEEQPLDTIVIGAGLAGLRAARLLAAQGQRVCVLEARDRVGGRTLSQPLNGDVVDLGAQWINAGQPRIAALIEELGVGTFPQFSTGRKVLELGEIRVAYQGMIPGLPLASLLDLQAALAQLVMMARMVPLENPFQASQAQRWDGWTVADWLNQRMFTTAARSLIDGSVRAIFAAEPREISFLHFLFFLRSGGSLLRLADVKNATQYTCVLGGTQQLSQRMAEDLGQQVVLNAPVQAIVQDESAVRVRSAAGEYAARNVIVAIPPAQVAAIDFQPGLPEPRKHLLTNLPMGKTIKCVMSYRTPFWRDQGLSGEVLSDASPLRLCFDSSPQDAAHGAITGFLLGESAREWSEQSRGERARMMRSELLRFFGNSAGQPLGYVEFDWTGDPWSGGYAAYAPPGVLSSTATSLREPIGRISWAGTETAVYGNGYMDGAIESGERAAKEVLSQVTAVS